MFRKHKSTTSVLVLISLVVYCSGIRVCPTKAEYDNILLPTKCSDNPDAGATPKQIADRWMISTQTEHNLVTSDGYIFLVLQCVPKDEDLTAAPVVLGHGIAMTSRAFLNLSNNTLVYHILKTLRRQVFIISFRGTIFSTETTNGKTINQLAYWTFTYEHLGLEEVALATSLAENLTGRRVVYIGFSMGTTAVFALCSLRPEFCEAKMIGIVALAPIAYLDHSSLSNIAKFWPLIEPIVKLLYNGRIFPRDETTLKLSTLNSFSMTSFYHTRSSIFGNNPDSIPWPYYPVCIINNPDAIGHYVIDHYVQNIFSGNFSRYDHKDQNIALYGTAYPPNYPLQDITVKISLVTGKNDLLAPEQDAEKLWDNLPAKCKQYSVTDPKFSHDNFVQHNDLVAQLVDPLLTIVTDTEAGRCT